MRIAYYTHYLGKELTERYFVGKKYSFAAGIKSQGIARALMQAGHEVVIYSTALPLCNKIVSSFEEKEDYPEGTLTIKYPTMILYRKCGILSELNLNRMIKTDHKINPYDVFVYYNIMYGSLIHVHLFKNCIKILEYEDNIFNKWEEGGKISYGWFKKLEYRMMLRKTDGAFAVSKGILNDDECKERVIVPGVINDEVIDSISCRRNVLKPNQVVKLIIMGGTGYDKGTDVLIKSLYYVQTPCVLDIYSNIDFYDAVAEDLNNIPKQHKVNFKGFLPHKELIKILDKEADILVCTTRSLGVRPQAAGFPSKMMDYSATGRPIVSSELAQLDDSFNEKITYYSGDDPKSLGEKIEEVIANYDEKVSQALELQKLVLEEYTIEGNSRKMNQLLKRLLNKK